jgi:hypothetical protein
MTLATWGALFIVHVLDELVPERVTIIGNHQREFARELGTKIANLWLVDVTSAHILRAGAAGRKAAAELTREVAPFMLAGATVYEEKGFTSSALRSIVTTACILARVAHPVRVFGELAPSLVWIEAQLEAAGHRDFDRAALAAALAELRQRGAAPPRR